MTAQQRYGICTPKEQKQIQTIFFLLRTKSFKNIEKIFEITKGLISEEREFYVKKAKERFPNVRIIND